MPWVDENGDEWYDLISRADLELFDAAVDALPEPIPHSARADLEPADHEVIRAAGGNEFRDYWTKGEGLAKWANHPHPWTTLRNHLRKHVGQARANRIASQWFHRVFGIWPGERKGDNPVGPG